MKLRMKNHTFEYVFRQVLWLLGTAAQLIGAMGIGMMWVIMTIRCMTFAILDLLYFMPHVFWYLISPNIIRRVSYRSSHTTKMRNLEALLSEKVLQESEAEATLKSTMTWRNRETTTDSGAERSRSQHPDTGPSPLIPDDVDRAAVERFMSKINPADGTFVNGLPVDITDDAGNFDSTATFPGGIDIKNSFDDTLAALQRVYRHRNQQQQQQQQQLNQSQSQHLSTSQSCNLNGAAPIESTAQNPPPLAESFSDDDTDDDLEDTMNLHNRAMLDIYLPVPLDSLFRFMDQERKSAGQSPQRHASAKHATFPQANKKNKADKGREPTGAKRKGVLTRKKFPILISVNGGAWIVGCYLWNFLVARLFAARGYVVFCPDYRNFPQTTMEGMTLDVSDAIAWVLNNAERYNGDLNNVTLIGQSAGAHLTMMSLLSQAQLSAYRHNNEAGQFKDIPEPSKVAYNVPRYNPRESIHRYVGLSGIYNLNGLVKHFDRRGLYRGVLHQIAGGKSRMPRYTLSAYFDGVHMGDTGEVLPDNIFDFFPKRMFFVHGDADKSAPVTESANIVYLMRNAQRDAIVRAVSEKPEAAKTLPKPVTIEYILVPGATHTDSIIEEPLSGNSHIVEFLCFYDLDDDQRRHAQLTGQSPSGGAGLDSRVHSRTPSVVVGSLLGETQVSVSKMMEPDALQSALSPMLSTLSKDAEYQFPVLPASRPDGILLSPCPSKSRRKLMRLASLICPF